MSKRFLMIAIPLVFAILTAVYAQLGGFNTPTLELVDVQGYQIAGTMFKGDYKDEELRSLFFKAKGLTGRNNSTGILTVINFPEAEKESGYIENFIGVLSDTFDRVPEHFQIKNYAYSKAIRVTIEGNNAVRPHPQDIRDMVYKFAMENKLDMQPVFIEQYIDNTTLQIDVPVK